MSPRRRRLADGARRGRCTAARSGGVAGRHADRAPASPRSAPAAVRRRSTGREPLPPALASASPLRARRVRPRATPRASAPAADGRRAARRRRCCGGSRRRSTSSPRCAPACCARPSARSCGWRSRWPSASCAARSRSIRALLVGDGARGARAARRARRGDHPPASRRLRRRHRAARSPRSASAVERRRRSGRQPRRLPRRSRTSASIDAGIDAQIRELARALLGDEHAPGGRRARPSAGRRAEPASRSTPTSTRLRTRRADAGHRAGGPRRRTAGRVDRTGRERRRNLRSAHAAAAPPLPVEVVGFRDGRLLSVPLGDTAGIRPGDRIVARGGVADDSGRRRRCSAASSTGSAGRSTAWDRCDAASARRCDRRRSIRWTASRSRMPIGTGVRAIDALLTCGRGQRIGVFGGSGVGKSTLLGMMARGTEADVVVLGLVGERGREVRSFLEHDLGPGGLERSVVVVSTSDSPPLARLRAAYAATAIAEHFRDDGKHVLLMMDSITRFAMAQREVGLAAGEPPTAKGYPPSVFARLPGLLERAGAVRGSRQHHRVLHRARRRRRPQRADRRRRPRHSRRPHRAVARSGGAQSLSGDRHPATASAGRCRDVTVAGAPRARPAQVREWLATLRDNEDLVSVGAYVRRQQSAHRRRARPARGDRPVPVSAGRHQRPAAPTPSRALTAL